MAYRRTENVVRKHAEREQTIIDAAQSIAGEEGMGAVQIAAVAHRADIAAGTVYRYFPSKNDLVAEMISGTADRELLQCVRLPNSAPGPLSALAACIATFAARALQERRLAWALTAEPVDADVDTLRLKFRRALVDEMEKRITAAVVAGHLPDLDPRFAAPAVVGAVLEGVVGPLAPSGGATREAVQTTTLLALRALGVLDARARGLVAQYALP